MELGGTPAALEHQVWCSRPGLAQVFMSLLLPKTSGRKPCPQLKEEVMEVHSVGLTRFKFSEAGSSRDGDQIMPVCHFNPEL